MSTTKVDVAIDPKTGNPIMRTTPEHRIKQVYAHNGMVVIVARVGEQETERIVDIQEAIFRATAIRDMGRKLTYSSDIDENQKLVEMFIDAIQKAKEQQGSKYVGVGVSMYNAQKQGFNA